METSNQTEQSTEVLAELAEIALILVQTSHPGNIGSSARAAKTMGMQRLTLVQPKLFPHPEATALASGADDLLKQAQVCDTLDQALAEKGIAYACSARRRGIPLAELDPREFAVHALKQAQTGPVAVVFGNERVGLSNDEIERCQFLVRIPSNPEFGSLNLGAAVQLLTYELRMAALAGAGQPLAQPDERVPAPLADMERMFIHLQDLLLRVRFFGSRSPKIMMARIRRLLQRSLPDAHEVGILRGIFAQMEYMLDHPGRDLKPDARAEEPSADGGSK